MRRLWLACDVYGAGSLNELATAASGPVPLLTSSAVVPPYAARKRHLDRASSGTYRHFIVCHCLAEAVLAACGRTACLAASTGTRFTPPWAGSRVPH